MIFDDIHGLMGLGAGPVPQSIYDEAGKFFTGMIPKLTGNLDRMAVLRETSTWAATFYDKVKSNYGDEGFAEPKMEEVIKGITYLIGPHFIGLDKKVYPIAKHIDEATFNYLAEQVNNMTDDPADSREWTTEENTLFFKCARRLHYDIKTIGPRIDALKIDLEGEAITLLYAPPTEEIRKFVATGAAYMMQHPILRPLYDAAIEFRRQSTKLSYIKIMSSPGRLFIKEVLKNEKLEIFYDKAVKVAFIVGVAVVVVVSAGAATPLLATVVPILGGIVTKLAAKDFIPPAASNIATSENTSSGSSGSGVQAAPNQDQGGFMSDLVNLRPTTATILSGLGAFSFLALLFMGAGEQKKQSKPLNKKS